MSASSGSTGRWVLMFLMLGASGWASFTLYERTTSASVTATPDVDPRVEQLVAESFELLSADELDAASKKLAEAAAVAPDDPRVHEGRVLLAVRRAERLFWATRLDPEGTGSSEQRLEELDHAVHAVREVVAKVRLTVDDGPTIARVNMYERRLNTMLVVAFASSGATERARGALAARLTTHPQRALLERYVGREPTAAPPASASASASVSASAAPPKPPVGNFPQPSHYEPHYELDHEPTMENAPKTPGELQLPATDPSPDLE